MNSSVSSPNNNRIHNRMQEKTQHGQRNYVSFTNVLAGMTLSIMNDELMTRYLRDALNNFCDETARMYKHLVPEDYTPSPTQSP